MKLSKQQIDYAFDRIDGIVNARVKAKAPAEIVDNSKPLSDTQKRQQIIDGVAKIKPKCGPYVYWTDAFDFVNPSYDVFQKKAKERNEKLAAIRKTEEKKAQKVKDKIMLSGDAEAALKMLDAYAAEA